MQVRDMPGCYGCPLFQDGSQPHVPDELVPGAPVFVVGQNPGADEAEAGRPFVGKTGRVMEKEYFRLAGLERGKVSIGNALRCRWQGSNELPPFGRKAKLAEQAVGHCKQAHFRVPEGTKLIISQGDYALYSLTGQTGVNKWRGALLPTDGSQDYLHRVWTPDSRDVPVLVTCHLAALFYDRTLVLPTKMDWMKVRRILANQWPQPLPEITTRPPDIWPKVSAFDTEFDRYTRELERYSLATPERQLYVVEATDAGLVRVPGEVTVVMHNEDADIEHLSDILGGGRARTEDTMLMHSVLWSDLPHTLLFLGSIYAQTNAWKHLCLTNPLEYSAGDALGTWDAWLGMRAEFQQDLASWQVYREEVQPLTPIILRATAAGLRLDQSRLRMATEALEKKLVGIEARAQAAVGWPINLGSPQQVEHWLYQVEKINSGKRRKGGRR